MPPPDNIGLKFFRAFTLAETLITLAIIGVVAALTMPSVIQHHKKQEASARLKKFYSMMQQAILLSETENGQVWDWNIQYSAFNTDDEDADEKDEECRTLSVYTFNKYIKPYIKYSTIDENKTIYVEGEERFFKAIKVSLIDGSSFTFRNGDCSDLTFDINSDKGPNKYGKDIYRFLLCDSDRKIKLYLGNNRIPFGPMCYPASQCNTREEALEMCKKNVDSCGKLLLFDNWEFKSDYPHKL